MYEKKTLLLCKIIKGTVQRFYRCAISERPKKGYPSNISKEAGYEKTGG